MLIIVAVSCNSSVDFSAIIYDDYFLTYYKGYVETLSENGINEPIWNVGDTIKLKDDCYLYIFNIDTDTFIDYSTNYFIIPANTELVISYASNNIFFELYSIDDSSIRGCIFRDQLEKCTLLGQMAQMNKLRFYARLNRNISLSIDTLKNNYNLTDSALFDILAREHFKRTGKNNFVIHNIGTND
jgi:hypothetical protein